MPTYLGRKSLKEAYNLRSLNSLDTKRSDTSPPKSVGIIGAGMAGLYAALLLQKANIPFHIFETNQRVGGRIYTYEFTPEPNQYFDAGAMRIPDTTTHKLVFNLIDYVNARLNASDKVVISNYTLSDDNNYVFMNGVKNSDGSMLTKGDVKSNPAVLGFPLPLQDRNKTADALLTELMQEFIDEFSLDFEKGFRKLVQYDDYSFRDYLIFVKCWNEDQINYLEIMTGPTNAFAIGFVDIVLDYAEFNTTSWKRIENGASRLPEALATLIGKEHISLGAQVNKITTTIDKVSLYINNDTTPQVFDAVIAAVPPSVLRMMDRPLWSQAKEHAIRSINFHPLWKIGLRFDSRFWEDINVTKGTPSDGGVSITDYPIRWVVYPSYGINDSGPGVLMCYNRDSDALKLITKSPAEQEKIALHNLALMYGDIVYSQFIESKAVSWALDASQGLAFFLPGQFKNLFYSAQQPEGNIYFAGEHLSINHAWIVGAIDGAYMACQQLLGDACKPLMPQDVALFPNPADFINLSNITAIGQSCDKPTPDSLPPYSSVSSASHLEPFWPLQLMALTVSATVETIKQGIVFTSDYLDMSNVLPAIGLDEFIPDAV